jgi:hypothetical protein
MDDSYLCARVTGYDNASMSLANSPPPNEIIVLLERFLDMSQCDYGDDEGARIGLEGSCLLAQLPWLTPWADLFKPVEPVEVF